MKENNEEFESPYCKICGHCGYIDCCGIIGFLDKHVKGKTNCEHEEQIIKEMIWLFDNVGKENERLKNELKEKENKIKDDKKEYEQIINTLKNTIINLI